jgi:hypothetical protein
MEMLLELYRRTHSGGTTEVCDLVSMHRGPVGPAYKALDHLLERGLIMVASGAGRRFRRLKLSEAALAEMTTKFPEFV